MIEHGHTVESLKAFEADIAECFARGEIGAPIHLGGGNEQALIDIFRDVQRDDWVFGAWRSHLHCLLHGVPPAELKAAIRRGHSMGLCFPEHRILCGAIVGGMAPIAVGVAAGIKRRGGDKRVWCFLGDMAWRSGIVGEAINYSYGHSLPITFIQEDNALSVCTNTSEAWGVDTGRSSARVKSYEYKLEWPHSGIGRHVSF